MASPSSSRVSPPPLARSSPLFKPIAEVEREGEADDEPTPQQRKSQATPKTPAKEEGRQLSVLCNKCRPSPREKTSVVPVDGASPLNPKTLLQSLLLTLTRKSPRPAPAAGSTSAEGDGGGEWRLAAQELSRKLVQATRRRDEALLESSRLKRSVAELERKLERLEACCVELRSAVEQRGPGVDHGPLVSAVAEARSAVRGLARALSGHVRPGRVASLVKVPIQSTGSLLVYMEAVLNRVFYEGFERATEEEARVLDPAARAEASRAGYEAVRGLTWEEVLSKGTRHYSEGLSRFCDDKMGEVVGMVGGARAWPEGLLQAFFGAAKGVWVLRLLARCANPPPAPAPLRVERGAAFEAEYMEEVAVGGGGTEKGRRTGGDGEVTVVRVMVAPGFYLYDGGEGGRTKVVKCKVVCGYGGGERQRLAS